jgi:hypothetical protein
MRRVELHPRRSQRIRITDSVIARAKQEVKGARINPFQLPDVPPGVIPDGVSGIAMDDNAPIANANAWAGQQIIGAAFSGGLAYASAYSEGLAFPGYAFLSELAQRPEYRRMSETLAMEMTRKWIELQSTDDVDKTKEIKELTDALDNFCVRDAFRKCVELDGFFGRSHLYIDTGSTDDRTELKQNLGNGRDGASRTKVTKGGIQGFIPVEPVWTYPTNYDSIDPLKKDWYNPKTWFVMGKEVHKSRLLKFVGREVPDLLKPAYSFGGLSMSQMAMPYVNNWLRTRQSVADIIHSFSVFVLKTDLSETLMQGGQELYQRAEFFNLIRDNKGLMMIDKDAEDFINVSATLGTLDALQAQTQEHMACLVAGTLVETNRGQIPIEEVTTNDKVMTRQGFMSVKWSGKTGETDRLIEIYSGGNVIRCTSEHPIWSESTNEFVNAGNVTRSHRLLVRNIVQENMDGRSRGVVVGGEEPRRGITAISKVADYSIASFGKRIAAQFRKVMKSIIRTKITGQTIPWVTSNLLHVPNMWNWMGAKAACSNANMFGNVKFVESNFESRILPQDFVRIDANTFLENANQYFSTNNASVVGKFLQRAVAAMGVLVHNFVPKNVGNVSDFMGMFQTLISFHNRDIGKSAAHTKNNADVVEKNLWQNSIEPGSVPIDACGASVTVVRTRNMSRKVTVYNLEVCGPPEFFANGILVHNSVSGIPIVKLLGIQPAGLNASSEGELRTFYDWILAMQEKMIRPNLTIVLDFLMLHLWGKVDPQITFSFKPLFALSEKEVAELRKTEAETGKGLVETGIVSPLEERKRLAADPESPYASINVEDVPDLREEEEQGLEPHAGAAKLAEGAGEEQGEIDVPNRGAQGAEPRPGGPDTHGVGENDDEADDSEPYEDGELRPDYIDGENPLEQGAAMRDGQPDHAGRGSPKNRKIAEQALALRERPGYKGELNSDYLEDENPLLGKNPLSGKNPVAGKNQLSESTLLRDRAAQRNAANPDRSEDEPPNNRQTKKDAVGNEDDEIGKFATDGKRKK